MKQPAVAVVGTYRSGSTIVAGMLHHLGVDMGAPFWRDFYEPRDLAQSLRRWWQEPQLVAAEAASVRVHLLRQWLASRRSAAPVVGAKHPLLCLSAPDIQRAWGTQTRFVWIRRDLSECVASLQRQQWFDDPDRIQQQLLNAAECFFANVGCLRLDFEQVICRPAAAVQQLVEYLGLQPDSAQLRSAVEFVRARQPERSSPPAAAGAGSLKLAATMLADNRESIVADAIRSVVDWVDWIILLDTGITDRTKAICETLAGERLVVRSLDWSEDFGRARNAALAVAKEVGADWALTLDTDERLRWTAPLTDTAALRAILSRETAVDVWLAANSDGSYTKERLLRVAAELRWYGRAHESLLGASPRARQVMPGLSFDELDKATAQLEDKLQRDLKLLRADLHEMPDNARAWYYLGQSLANLGQHEGAIAAFERCATLRHWDELAAWACFMAAKSCAALGLWEEAIDRCAAGLAIDACFPELAWMSGWCHFQLRAYRQAIAWSHMAVSLGCVAGTGDLSQRIGFRDLVAWYEGPFDVLRHAYAQQQQQEGLRLALQNYELAVARRQKLQPTPVQRTGQTEQKNLSKTSQLS